MEWTLAQAATPNLRALACIPRRHAPTCTTPCTPPPARPHLHAVVTLPGIGHEQHDFPLGQLPVLLPVLVAAALELFRLLLRFLPDPGPALPAAPGLPVLLQPDAHGCGGLHVPGHGGRTKTTWRGEHEPRASRRPAAAGDTGRRPRAATAPGAQKARPAAGSQARGCHEPPGADQRAGITGAGAVPGAGSTVRRLCSAPRPPPAGWGPPCTAGSGGGHDPGPPELRPPPGRPTHLS